jgi:hypothetical protein
MSEADVSVAYQYLRKNTCSVTWHGCGASEPAAVARAIKFFCMEAALQFRVVAVKVGIAKAKQTAVE